MEELPLSGKLQREIRRSQPFENPEVEAFLSLERTAEVLQGQLAKLLKPAGVSPAQYNVLRILRGAGDEGLPCGEIGERMVQRDPDITRLIDRMEQRGWVARIRSSADRRVVRVRILGPAIEILNHLEQPVLDLHRRQFAQLNGESVQNLIDILEKLR
jgi:DNA-binding MarR family transcriptional regulator